LTLSNKVATLSSKVTTTIKLPFLYLEQSTQLTVEGTLDATQIVITSSTLTVPEDGKVKTWLVDLDNAKVIVHGTLEVTSLLRIPGKPGLLDGYTGGVFPDKIICGTGKLIIVSIVKADKIKADKIVSDIKLSPCTEVQQV